jgi:hypothetical protein
MRASIGVSGRASDQTLAATRSRSTFGAEHMSTSATMREDNKSERLAEYACNMEPICRFEVDSVDAAFWYPSALLGSLLEDFAS